MAQQNATSYGIGIRKRPFTTEMLGKASAAAEGKRIADTTALEEKKLGLQRDSLNATADQFNKNLAQQKQANEEAAAAAGKASTVSMMGTGVTTLGLTKDMWYPTVKEGVKAGVNKIFPDKITPQMGVEPDAVASAAQTATQTEAAGIGATPPPANAVTAPTVPAENIGMAGRDAGAAAGEVESMMNAVPKVPVTEAVTASEGTGLIGTSAPAATEISTGVLAPSTELGAGTAMGTTTAAGAEVGMGVGGAAMAAAPWVAAALAGKSAFGGDPEKDYEDKNVIEKTFASPAIAGAPGFDPLMSSSLDAVFGKDNPMSQINNWLGDFEQKGVSWIFNGFSGKGPCIIVTCCTSRDSEEVQVAREYRDKLLSPTALRGYYIIADELVPVLEQYPDLKQFTKETLVDPLIEYGRFKLGMTSTCSKAAVEVANEFIKKCQIQGAAVEHYTRSNGEVY